MSKKKPLTIEEQEELIRKLWKWCTLGALVVLFVTGTATFALYFSGYDLKAILTFSTVCFQLLLISYGLGVFIPLISGSYVKMGMGISMSKEGLALAKKTSETLDTVQKEVMPLVQEAKDLSVRIHSVSDEIIKIINQVKEGDKSLARTIQNGMKEVRATIQDGESELESWIYKKIDTFLEGVFNGRQETEDVDEDVDVDEDEEALYRDQQAELAYMEQDRLEELQEEFGEVTNQIENDDSISDEIQEEVDQKLRRK